MLLVFLSLLASAAAQAKINTLESQVPFIPATYAPVVEELWNMYTETPQLAATMVRLAWHSAGTYIKDSGQYGSNGGHIYYDSVLDWDSNAGLKPMVELLEPIHQRFSGLTRADLYVLSGIVGVAFTDGPWVHFCGGREDKDESSAPPRDPHLLPGAEDPLDDLTNFQLNHVSEHITEIFARMGFDQQEMVALLAAHSIGRMHKEASGYIGTWDTTEFYMNSEYFFAILNLPWSCFTLPSDYPPEQYAHDPSNPAGEPPLNCSQALPEPLAYNMNPADLALKYYPDFRPYTALYAEDQSQMHRDFARAWNKLLMNGVTCDHTIKITDLQAEPVFIVADIFQLGEDGVAALLMWLVFIGATVILLSAICLMARFHHRPCRITAKPPRGMRAHLMA